MDMYKCLTSRRWPQSEYDTFHSIGDLVGNRVEGMSLSRGIHAKQHALHWIACRVIW